MDSEAPSKIRLVEGRAEGAGVVYSGKLSEGVPANWFDVAIIGATGLIKMKRP